MYEKYGSSGDLEAARKRAVILFEQMRDRGVKFYVDDKMAHPMEAAAKSVCEDSPYMADYVFGDAGEIKQVRFDKVTVR